MQAMRPLGRTENLANLEGRCNLVMSLVQAYRLMAVMGEAMPAKPAFALFQAVKRETR